MDEPRRRVGRQLPLFDEPERGPDAAAVDRALRRVDAAEAGDALRELGRALPPRLHLGTSSWSFPGWAGLVYRHAESARELARHGLAAYARHPLLRAVGVDRGYYRPVEATQYARWADLVPSDFRFLVKADERLTVARFPRHRRYGADAGQPNPRFLDAEHARLAVVAPCLQGLGARAGPLVFQFPPQDPTALGAPEDFAGRLRRFLAALPVGPLYAVEIRNPEWLGAPLRAALAETGVAPCLTVHPRMPGLDEQAQRLGAEQAPALVVRWMLAGGLDYEQARGRYQPFDRLVDEDGATRSTLAGLCAAALDRGRPAYVIVNNKAEGSAPLSVGRLAEQLVRGAPD